MRAHRPRALCCGDSSRRALPAPRAPGRRDSRASGTPPAPAAWRAAVLWAAVASLALSPGLATAADAPAAIPLATEPAAWTDHLIPLPRQIAAMDVLIFGGTRYFGRCAVEVLLEQGHRVTIFSRGNTRPPFWSDVEHIAGDRHDADGVVARLRGRRFDGDIDNQCFRREDAETAVLALRGQVGRYVVASTVSIYGEGGHAKRVWRRGNDPASLERFYVDYRDREPLREVNAERRRVGADRVLDAHSDLPWTDGLYAPFAQNRISMDLTKAARDIGLHPTPLRAWMQATVGWYAAHPEALETQKFADLRPREFAFARAWRAAIAAFTGP